MNQQTKKKFDDVLKRMLSMPPDPHKPTAEKPKAKKPKATKKKPA
jgi:hypothetical protein